MLSQKMTNVITFYMPKEKFKYRINEIIDSLPRSISVKEIETTLEKEYKISPATFHRDKAIKLNDSGSIPTDRLDSYSDFFCVRADELKNYSIIRSHGKTINDLLNPSL